MKNILYLILLIFPVLLYNCGPDNPLKPNPQQADTLPPITSGGLQTFGYKINGKVVRYESQSARYVNLDHIPETGSFGITLANRDFIFWLRHDSILSTGTFELDPKKLSGTQNAHAANFFNELKNLRYNILHKGGVEILRYHIDNDKPEYIISGTFWCTLLNKDNPLDTAFITDGRFDLYKR